MSNVLTFPSPSRDTDTDARLDPTRSSSYGTETVIGGHLVVRPKLHIVGAVDDADSRAHQITVDQLYSEPAAVAPDLSTALRLLTIGINCVSVALEEVESGNDISADDAMQRVQALAPELFCCRTLGDGFGAIVIAVYHGLANLSGQPPNVNQIRTVGKALRRLRNHPFLSFDTATDEIIGLEEVGFKIAPETFNSLSDWLDGESIR